MPDTIRLAVTGANGRIGQILQAAVRLGGAEGLQFFWLGRKDWDIISERSFDFPSCDAVLDLSGITKGEGMEQNPILAANVARQSLRIKAKHFFFSTAGVYPGGTHDFSEEDAPLPSGLYGASKLASETALRQIVPDAVVLRVGNVAGADALLAGNRKGSAVLDQTDDGRGPIRSYIGPKTLVETLFRLVQRLGVGRPVPNILNLSQPGELAMAQLLTAARFDWRFHPDRFAPIPRAVMSTDRIETIFPMKTVSAQRIVDEVRLLAPDILSNQQ